MNDPVNGRSLRGSACHECSQAHAKCQYFNDNNRAGACVRCAEKRLPCTFLPERRRPNVRRRRTRNRREGTVNRSARVNAPNQSSADNNGTESTDGSQPGRVASNTHVDPYVNPSSGWNGYTLTRTQPEINAHVQYQSLDQTAPIIATQHLSTLHNNLTGHDQGPLAPLLLQTSNALIANAVSYQSPSLSDITRTSRPSPFMNGTYPDLPPYPSPFHPQMEPPDFSNRPAGFTAAEHIPQVLSWQQPAQIYLQNVQSQTPRYLAQGYIPSAVPNFPTPGLMIHQTLQQNSHTQPEVQPSYLGTTQSSSYG